MVGKEAGLGLLQGDNLHTSRYQLIGTLEDRRLRRLCRQDGARRTWTRRTKLGNMRRVTAFVPGSKRSGHRH